MEPIKVGIVGFGRSGCNIHANGIARMREMFDVVAIADFIPERRSHAEFPNAKRPRAEWKEALEAAYQNWKELLNKSL